MTAASSICSHALRTAAGNLVGVDPHGTVQRLADHVLFQVKVEVEEVPAGQKAYVGLLRRGGLRLPDREAFQDLDVLRAELPRLFAIDAEALQSDRS